MSLDLIQIEKTLLNHNVRVEIHYIFNVLINSLAKKGKRTIAKKIISKINFFIKYKKKISSLVFLYKAISNIRPLLGQKNKSGFNKKPQVKILSSRKSIQLALNWLIQGAKKRSERTMSLRLYNELVDAYNKKGFAIKKKYEWHMQPLSTQLKTYSFKKSKSVRVGNTTAGVKKTSPSYSKNVRNNK